MYLLCGCCKGIGQPTIIVIKPTVYPKKYANGFCFAVLCCGYTLADFSISIRLTPLALWQSNDCPSASKATLMNMDKYFMWIHYERLHNHNKAKHNKAVCLFLGIYCTLTRTIKPCFAENDNFHIQDDAHSWWSFFVQSHVASTLLPMLMYREHFM